MQFEQSRRAEKIGVVCGFLFSYFLFTTILYFILTFFNKLPVTWTYFHVIAITIVITLIGYTLKKVL